MHDQYGSNKCIVLPTKCVENKCEIANKKIAILLHFHYLDTVKQYCRYVQNIPEYIDIYITTSINDVAKECIQLFGRKRIKGIIHKNNRGRDISAFLVAAKSILRQYEYIGFIHDKKANSIDVEDDVEEWIHSLWHNMLASSDYVNNLLEYFEQHSSLGVLVPPILLSQKLCFAVRNTWGNNFKNTMCLLKTLNTNVVVNEDKYPMTIGTVFWARTVSLKKLLSYDWSYNDFPQEPLALDGTIGHAVERSLEYIAKDAGYETMWVMSDEYAAYQYEKMNSVIRNMFSILSVCYGVGNLLDVDRFAQLVKVVSKKNEGVYVYGAGKVGSRVNLILQNMNVLVKAHVVTNIADNVDSINGVKVTCINELNISKEDFFIIAVKGDLIQREIIKLLKKRGASSHNISCWQLSC